MKKLLSVLLAVVLLTLCTFSASAETFFSEGDWVYSPIKDGSLLEIKEYTGEGEDIVIPRIVMDRMVVSIASHCFTNNTTVKTVETSSPLWTVSDYAFLNCTSLEKFTCNFALKEIGVGAFSGTTALKSIDLENSVVTVIRPHAFMNSGINKVVLPDTCTEVMHEAFSQCPNLKEVNISDSVTTIGEKAFASCGSLKKVILPDSVTEIADNAFDGCPGSLTIVCNPGSYAEAYATQHGISTINPGDILPGDADGNGSVNINDVTAIQKYKLGKTELSYYGSLCADVNGDGDITIRDATLIQMKIAGMTVDF